MKSYKEIFFANEEIKQYRFTPLPDITAYELSLLLPLIFNKKAGIKHHEEKLKQMPPEIMRHITAT